MKPTRTRAFEREIRTITTIAGAAAGNLQLSLDEQLPGKVHGHDQIIPTEYGYHAHCLCGWVSVEFAAKRSAHHAIRSHIGRTPQGRALLDTIRRVGRGGNGA